MRRRDRRVIAAVVAIAVAAVVAVVVLATRGSSPKPKGVQADRTTTIKVNGVSLAAEIITPKHANRAPLIVMPAAWGAPATMYRLLGARLARAGYQVVAYAQRGFRGSTGQIDLAGPATQRDASAVITWALTHTRADPQRVGMLGMSYGAGVALLTAAHDKRVRAVVATSTWADLADAFDENDTPSRSALQVLLGAKGRSYDAAVQTLRRTLSTAPKDLGGVLHAMSPTRSPSSYVAELNRNKPAIMLANAFEDSIFSPSQLLPFFAQLTTPKRLELAAGDHGGPERASLTGGTSATIDDAVAWLDHYLRGVASGVDPQPQILLRDIRTSQPHPFSTWPRAGEPTPLGRPGGDQQSTTWSATLHAGQDSIASNGPAQYVQSTDYHPPQAAIARIAAGTGLVWTGRTLTKSTPLNGTPRVHLALNSDATAASVFAYLYDVAPNGIGTLLDMAPYSVTGLTRGAAREVTFAMQPTSYTVPAGHRITLVVDAADPRFQSLAPDGTAITVSSTAADPATLTLPVTG